MREIKRGLQAARLQLRELHGTLFHVAPSLDGDVGEVLGGHAWWHTERKARKTYICFNDDGSWYNTNSTIIPFRTLCVVTTRRFLEQGEQVSMDSFADVAERIAIAFNRGRVDGVYIGKDGKLVLDECYNWY